MQEENDIKTVEDATSNDSQRKVDSAVSSLATHQVNLSLFNQIGPKGATALAANKSIATLDVSNNQIGDVGAKHLAESMSIVRLTESDLAKYSPKP